MNIKNYSHPDTLEYYSFIWSEVRLVVAAFALLLGGIPVLSFVIRIPALSGLVGLILTITWIISGLASAYLLYRWLTGKQMLFGGKNRLDTGAFLISVISGINLGLVGLLGVNIGMRILANYTVFVITALIYLVVAAHLYRRWNASGKKIF